MHVEVAAPLAINVRLLDALVYQHFEGATLQQANRSKYPHDSQGIKRACVASQHVNQAKMVDSISRTSVRTASSDLTVGMLLLSAMMMMSVISVCTHTEAESVDMIRRKRREEGIVGNTNKFDAVKEITAGGLP